MADFNLDELIHLAKNDLDLFEQKRLEIIASFIDSVLPNEGQDELLTIQMKIDRGCS